MSSISVTPTVSFPKWAGWVASGWGTALAFLWGFAEGILFFILPDVPLSFVALFRPRRALIHIVAIVAGAVLAGAVMYTWSTRSAGAAAVVARVPAVAPAMFVRAESDWTRYGVWGTSLGPMRGIPYKVYAVEAPAHSGRLVVVWLGFAETGLPLRKVGRASLAPTLHAVFWVVTYAIYWSTV